MSKTSKFKCKSGVFVKAHRHPDIIFHRALALANVRDNVTTDWILAHPIGLIPSALFHDDGTMWKCCKSNIIHFLEEEVCSSFNRPRYDKSHTVLIRYGINPEVVNKISFNGVSNSVDLYSTQEETDTRILLHPLYADNQIFSNRTKSRIGVQSSDNDVLVLCIHNFPKLGNTEELWFQTGSVSNLKDGRRFSPVHEICRSLGPLIVWFRCDIPVVIMGETGCGKTSLVKFMCALQRPAGVHGGTKASDIVEIVQTAERIARLNSQSHNGMFTVLFFDEANTTEAIGLIKEIMCDKCIEGRPIQLHEKLKIVAACNPYRK
ncbi:RNF213 [Mytilus edulis]|uniref:RNF213 n=1 Tax=Mytilus edulis TaxID=6550 RepID=A0A8S3S1L4_MYTED|nr:RNF213 [Mytilus edulis]